MDKGAYALKSQQKGTFTSFLEANDVFVSLPIGSGKSIGSTAFRFWQFSILSYRFFLDLTYERPGKLPPSLSLSLSLSLSPLSTQ